MTSPRGCCGAASAAHHRVAADYRDLIFAVIVHSQTNLYTSVETTLNGRNWMKLRIALLAVAALGGAALSTGTASAMLLAPLGQFQSSNVENVAVVCGPRGCVRTRPVYRRGAYVVRRPYVRRSYGYHRSYRRY